MRAVRVGARRVRVRESDLERFIAAGDTRTEAESESVLDGVRERPAVDHRSELGAALAASSAALADADDDALAEALIVLADAASSLAHGLRERSPAHA